MRHLEFVYLFSGLFCCIVSGRRLREETNNYLTIGEACQGGEHKPFTAKTVPNTRMFTTSTTGERVPRQEARPRSSGTCQRRRSCEKTPTASRQGANGCEHLPKRVVCCSETPCNDGGKSGNAPRPLDGYCALKSQCRKEGKHSESDIVYGGTATGCRHLPDDVMCCTPIEEEVPETTTEPVSVTTAQTV